jgi:hypothetical protein
MPKKSRLPTTGTFFVSESEYMELAGAYPLLVNLYVRTDHGWYRNGTLLFEDEIPLDLWPVRPVQRG